MMQTREERVSEFKPVRSALKQHSEIENVGINVGMPMAFDPRKGEVPKPDGVEFKLMNKSQDAMSLISDVCDQYGMKVRLPEYKQPGFTYDGRTYERDYDAFVQLVPE